MGDTEPSQLRGAFNNFLDSQDYFNQDISGNTEKRENCVFKLKVIILFSSALVSYILIEIYSKDNSDLLINGLWFLMILPCFACLLFHKYVPWRHLFDSFKEMFRYSWRYPIGCLRNQTEEYTSCQPATLHDEINEHTVNRFASQHDAEDEEIVYKPAVLRHRFFKLGRIFCCPRSCYPSVSTEDISNQTEEYTACQPSPLYNANEEQTENQFPSQHDAREEGIADQTAVRRYRFLRLGRFFFCSRRCYSSVSTEDLRNQTEEYTACQPSSLYNANEEQIENQFSSEHDDREEGIADQTAVRRYRFLRLGRFFCCPRSCYPSVSTEDLRNQTEECNACQVVAPHDVTEEQTVYQSDRIQEQMVFQPDSLLTTSEDASIKLQIAEQRLLRYLLSSTEEQESSSNE